MLLGIGLVFALLAGCALGPSSDLENIDPQTLPQRLIATADPAITSSPDSSGGGGGVYFLRDDRLVKFPASLDPASGPAAVQQLLDLLTAGPDNANRERGYSTALTPATQLRLTRLEGDLVTLDLTVAQLPPDQTTAIAQIVLTVTSLSEVNALRLTINGQPINAPLSNGAQTDRPLTREDYADMLA
jgi:hypothetical protein